MELSDFMGLVNGTVKLESKYDTWKSMFEEEKNILNNIFDEDVFKIEHVGSTAVKGLSAKPIVDIAIGVNSFAEIDKYMTKLSEYYTIKENLDYNEILLIKENEKETFCLIHVLLINDIRYKNMIRFRDILINNNDILKEYKELKEKLANEYSNDRKAYTKSKNDYIEKILKTTNN